MGFENTYTLAVRKRDSRFKNVELISQLQGRARLFHLGADHEFLERKDGFGNFSEKYQLRFQKDKIWTMNSGLMYSALNNKKVDMIMAYSTDGRIKAFNLKKLKDDKKFFPSYSAAYLTRASVLKRFPEIRKAFHVLEGNISEGEMMALNNQVDQLKYGLSQTARNFLIEKGLLIEEAQKLESSGLIPYYLSKRGYLFQILMEHLLLVLVPLLLALLFSLPVGVWSIHNSRVEKVVFTTINTLQTVPSLALLALFIPLLGIGFCSGGFCFIYLFPPAFSPQYF